MELVRDRPTDTARPSPLVTNQAGADRECLHRHRDKGEVAGKVVSGARNQPHACIVPSSQDAKAIMLDFVNPAWAGRGQLGARWQTRFDNAQPWAGTFTQHTHRR